MKTPKIGRVQNLIFIKRVCSSVRRSVFVKAIAEIKENHYFNHVSV